MPNEELEGLDEGVETSLPDEDSEENVDSESDPENTDETEE